MTEFDTSQVDLELGHCHCHHHHHHSSSSDGSSDEEGSCNSQFYSTIDNQSLAYVSDIEKDFVLERESSTMESDCDGMVREREERDCRICHMSLGDDECGVGIELGCCCKDDLAAAHKTCAEAWFKIKGNKTCEICNSVARNVFNSNENEPSQQINDPNVTTTNAVPSSNESQGCINGHRFVNFLLACMVFIFILSWLFHFKIHS